MAIKVEKEQEAEKRLKDLLKNMTIGLENVGFVNPLKKVYNLSKDLDYFPLAAAIITLQTISQLKYDEHLYSLVTKHKETLIDGPPFIVGMITLFK